MERLRVCQTGPFSLDMAGYQVNKGLPNIADLIDR